MFIKIFVLQECQVAAYREKEIMKEAGSQSIEE